MRAQAQKVAVVVSRLVLIGAIAVLMFLGFGPRLGAYRTLTVLTGSMRPRIPAGSVIVATPISPLSIKVGDVIAYEAPVADRHVVMHRVIFARQINGAVVINTRGDANPAPDPWDARIADRVAWKVRASVPYAGKILTALRSKKAHTLLVLVLPFILAGVWLRDIWFGAPDAIHHLERRVISG